MEKSEDYDDKSWLAVYLLELWLCLLYASLCCLINAGVCRGHTGSSKSKGILWAVSGYSVSF